MLVVVFPRVVVVLYPSFISGSLCVFRVSVTELLCKVCL